jgi:hypothetical protein
MGAHASLRRSEEQDAGPAAPGREVGRMMAHRAWCSSIQMGCSRVRRWRGDACHFLPSPPMNTTFPAPARLRIAIEGSDCLPTFVPEFTSYVNLMASAGITPEKLHPVIALLLRRVALIHAPHHGWTRALAIELAAEQAEEFRQLGLPYQLNMLLLALDQDHALIYRRLDLLRVGQTELALRELDLPGPDHGAHCTCHEPQRRRKRRR